MRFHNIEQTKFRISICRNCPSLSKDTLSCVEQGENKNVHYPIEDVVSVGRVPCPKNYWEPISDTSSLSNSPPVELVSVVSSFKQAIQQL